MRLECLKLRTIVVGVARFRPAMRDKLRPVVLSYDTCPWMGSGRIPHQILIDILPTNSTVEIDLQHGECIWGRLSQLLQHWQTALVLVHKLPDEVGV